MRADNTAHLITAAQRRHELTRAKAIRALHELDQTGGPVTFETVARQALLTEQSREFPQFSGWMTTESDMVCGHDRRW